MNGTAENLASSGLPENPVSQSARPKRKRATGTAAALAITGMVRSGIPVSKASEMLGFNPSTGYRIMQRQAGEEGTPALLSAVRDEKLAALVDNFLDKGIKMGAGKIKASDALGAGKLYADRRYPIRQENGGGPSMSFVTINLGMMAQGLADPPALDVSPIPENGPLNPQSAVFDGDGI
jgi:hypothetical protein